MPRRPTALEVTESYSNTPSSSSPTLVPPAPSTSTLGRRSKRSQTSEPPATVRKGKRSSAAGSELDPEIKRARIIATSWSDLTVTNETRVIEGEVEPETNAQGVNDKPVRWLAGFVFYTEADSLISLEEVGKSRVIGVGIATPSFREENEEDQGQEDSDERDAENSRGTALRLLNVENFSEVWHQDNEAYPYIETEFAWYKLCRPSHNYREHFEKTMQPRVAARFAIRHMYRFEDPRRFKEALDQYLDPSTQKRLGINAYPFSNNPGIMKTLRKAMTMVPLEHPSRQSALLCQILSNKVPAFEDSGLPTGRLHGENGALLSADLDHQALAAENLVVTTVVVAIYTFVALYCLVSEQLYCLASRRPNQNTARATSEEKTRREWFHRNRNQTLWKRMQQKRKATVEHQGNNPLAMLQFNSDSFPRAINDVVLVPLPGQEFTKEELEKVSDVQTLWNYFRAGIIIDFTASSAHIRWLTHSSQSMQQELHNQHELFLTDECSSAPLEDLVGVMTNSVTFLDHDNNPAACVHCTQNTSESGCSFFVRFLWDEHTGASTDFDRSSLFAMKERAHGDKCPVCLKEADQAFHQAVTFHRQQKRFICAGEEYHVDDFVLLKGPRLQVSHPNSASLRSGNQLCTIGQITKVNFVRSTIQVRLWLRMVDMQELYGFEPDLMLDERHLFRTECLQEYSPTMESVVLGKAHVHHAQPLAHSERPLDASLYTWLARSPSHFYATYTTTPGNPSQHHSGPCGEVPYSPLFCLRLVLVFGHLYFLLFISSPGSLHRSPFSIHGFFCLDLSYPSTIRFASFPFCETRARCARVPYDPIPMCIISFCRFICWFLVVVR